MASSSNAAQDATPLLPYQIPHHEQHQPASNGSEPSAPSPHALNSARRRDPFQETLLHHLPAEPILPASVNPPEELETRFGKPRWAHLAELPNRWSRFRYLWKEELAEFWGTFMILVFGTGSECQVNLHYRSSAATHGALYGDYLQGRLSWAVGVAMAVWMAGGISGAHCNPTVTIALAMFRRFPARKVPSFILAQIAGAAFGSLLVYGNYTNSISNYEGGDNIRTILGPHATAPFFFTIPSSLLHSSVNAFYSEFLASAVLLAIVFALADKSNLAPPRGTTPIGMFLALLGIGASLGANTGYAMNGARDTGPRIVLWLVGYGGQVWTHDHLYFIWGPWVAAIVGGITGASVYDAFLYTGVESPFNRSVSGSKQWDLDTNPGRDIEE